MILILYLWDPCSIDIITRKRERYIKWDGEKERKKRERENDKISSSTDISYLNMA